MLEALCRPPFEPMEDISGFQGLSGWCTYAGHLRRCWVVYASHVRQVLRHRSASHSWLFCSLAIAVPSHTKQGFACLAAWTSRSPTVLTIADEALSAWQLYIYQRLLCEYVNIVCYRVFIKTLKNHINFVVLCLIKGLLLCLFAKVKSYQPNLKRITFLTGQ